jgi:alpha-L-fucosidase
MQAAADDLRILSLGKNSKVSSQKVASIKMLGSSEKIKWNQENEALVITKPSKLPNWQVIGFKIEFQK